MSQALRHALPTVWMTAGQFMNWPGDGTARRFQLIDGEPVAMAPPALVHCALQARLTTELNIHLRRARPGCEALTGAGVGPDLNRETNVRVPALTVICGSLSEKIATAPLLIVEILSPSNAPESREAVRALLSLPSLREILLLHSEEIGAEISRRNADGGWTPEPAWYGPADDLVLESIGFRLPMRELYAGLNLR
jgi:Uma2 family endonuclease